MSRQRLDVELLAHPEIRARLSLWQVLWLYLDPFCLFKNVTVGSAACQAEAEEYNRRHRRILLAYVGRWASIGAVCLACMASLVAPAMAAPVLIVPIVGLELGFAAALFVLLVSLAVYVLLGMEKP